MKISPTEAGSGTRNPTANLNPNLNGLNIFFGFV
jgi:hypothetical protein